MSRYRFEYRIYQRPFRQPLQTSHGVWAMREGLLLRLVNPAGQVGWGEIAPLEWFGSETLAQALQFCRALGAEVTDAQIQQIPDSLPACQFGFEAAQAALGAALPPDLNQALKQDPEQSHLLPAGAEALAAWKPLWENGARTFKWKIGVGDCAQEIEILEQLVSMLPPAARLRLDANAGLNESQTERWLHHCDRLNATPAAKPAAAVEFLEQPLPPQQFQRMLSLSRQFQTPIGLDESVSNLNQLEACYQQGWRGIFVVKAAIVGSPRRLQQFCQRHPVDLVWSSVFETATAQRYIFDRLIPSCPTVSSRAVGFGIHHWFADAEAPHASTTQTWVVNAASER